MLRQPLDRIRAANMLVRQYAATDARLLYVDAFTRMLGPERQAAGGAVCRG
jgi:hypothetical protein